MPDTQILCITLERKLCLQHEIEYGGDTHRGPKTVGLEPLFRTVAGIRTRAQSASDVIKTQLQEEKKSRSATK